MSPAATLLACKQARRLTLYREEGLLIPHADPPSKATASS
jgi:hypothetical protein